MALGGALLSTPSANPVIEFNSDIYLLLLNPFKKICPATVSRSLPSHLHAMCSYVLAVALASSAVKAVINRSSRDECLPGCSEPILCRSSFSLYTNFRPPPVLSLFHSHMAPDSVSQFYTRGISDISILLCLPQHRYRTLKRPPPYYLFYYEYSIYG